MGFAGPGRPPMKTEALPKEMMPQVIDTFLKKVRMYQSFGYDGLAMRIEGHLAPAPNARQDEYGGSLENRTRFIREVLAAVKKEFGPSFILEVCIAGEQPQGYTGGRTGYGLEEAIEFAKLIDGTVDILQIREKDITKSHPTGFTFQKGEHAVIGYAAAMKKAGVSKMLLEPIGGFHDPDELEQYLADGVCDMFGMARAFMCDPEYGKKIQEGRGEDIIPCLFCNKCHGTMTAPFLSFCSVNPLMGYEAKLGRMVPPAGESKKVAVIGGGPAGMRAAMFAADRGHSVTLYEKTGILGGQLIHGDYSSFKWPVGDFKNWLIRQTYQKGIKVLLNTAPTAEQIAAEGYDAVIAATGASPKTPNILGLHDENGKPIYPTCLDVYGKQEKLGKRVVIIGGSETGIETAMYLCENGHDVTITTRQDEIAKDASHLHYITMAYINAEGRDAAAWTKYDNLTCVVNANTVAVEPGKVTYETPDGTHTVECDSIVVCGGMDPNLDSALSFADSADQFFVIGDANGCGNLQRCMRDAWSKTSLI
jgi:thioredoxin reductase